MHEINEKKERLGEYHRLCVELQSSEDSRKFPINFSVNSSAIAYCPPGKFVSKTQMSAARLLFDGDNAILHNTVRTPSRRDKPPSGRTLKLAAHLPRHHRPLHGLRQLLQSS